MSNEKDEILNSEFIIAGKTHSEILLMHRSKRSQWYKTILSEDKTKAMEIVEIARRAKDSVAKMGMKNPNFGRMGEDHPKYGKTHTKKTKAKQSAAHMGEKNYWYGKIFSEEHKLKISVSKMGHTTSKETCIKISVAAKLRTGENAPNYIDGRSLDPRYQRRYSLGRLGLSNEFIELALNQKKKRTDIEMVMEYWLINNEISYEFQRYINLLSTYTKVDFFIEPNLCLYCVGDRWHKLEERRMVDERITKELESMGYKVIRLWGSDIRDGVRPLEILELPQLEYEQQLLEPRENIIRGY